MRVKYQKEYPVFLTSAWKKNFLCFSQIFLHLLHWRSSGHKAPLPLIFFASASSFFSRSAICLLKFKIFFLDLSRKNWRILFFIKGVAMVSAHVGLTPSFRWWWSTVVLETPNLSAICRGGSFFEFLFRNCSNLSNSPFFQVFLFFVASDLFLFTSPSRERTFWMALAVRLGVPRMSSSEICFA